MTRTCDLPRQLCTLSLLAPLLFLGAGLLGACQDEPAAETGSGSEESETTASATETGEEPVDCSERPLELPSARADAEGVWDAPRQRMVMFAGDHGTPIQCMSQTDFLSEVWAFHTDCDNFEQLDPGPGLPPRGRYAIGHDVERERVLIHGGRYRDGTSGSYTVLDDLWAYDLTTDTWTELPAGASPRSNHVGAVVGDQFVIHGGNSSDNGLAFTPLGDTWALDLNSDTWSMVATTNDPAARLFHSGTAGPDNTLIIYAGGDESAFTGPFFPDMWVLELDSGAWTQLDSGATGPVQMISADLLYDAEGSRLLLWGGHEDTLLGNINTVWSFDLGGGGWEQLEIGDVYNAPANGFCDFPADFVIPDLDAPERRSAGAAVLSDAGEMLIFGGRTDCGLINDLWSWSLSDEVWTERSQATVGEICLRAFANCQSMCF